MDHNSTALNQYKIKIRTKINTMLAVTWGIWRAPLKILYLGRNLEKNIYGFFWDLDQVGLYNLLIWTTTLIVGSKKKRIILTTNLNTILHKNESKYPSVNFDILLFWSGNFKKGWDKIFFWREMFCLMTVVFWSNDISYLLIHSL